MPDSEPSEIPTFFQHGNASPIYERYRDHPDMRADHERIEQMWRAFAPFCGDPFDAFLTDARQNLFAHIWEMRLASVLVDAGFELVKPPPNGPDLGVRTSNATTWIEATAVEPGEGPDAPQRIEVGQFRIGRFDHDKILLRYTNGLLKKQQQHEAFLRRGVVHEGDRFVVAINAGAIQNATLDRYIPNIVRAVYPVGDPVWVIPFESDQPLRTEFPHRPSIPKTTTTSGVPASAFLDDRFARISAVFFSPIDKLESDPRDLIVVHHARPNNPIARGLFEFGREYWASENEDRAGFVIDGVDHRKRGKNE